jgi:hypothetical protein
MGMRKDWQTAKSNSELAFKHLDEETKKKNQSKSANDILSGGFEPYPINFNKKLGPALDDWESADKKKDDKKKQNAAKQAKTAIDYYEAQAKELKGPAQTFLTSELGKIKTKLGLH